MNSKKKTFTHLNYQKSNLLSSDKVQELAEQVKTELDTIQDKLDRING